MKPPVIEMTCNCKCHFLPLSQYSVVEFIAFFINISVKFEIMYFNFFCLSVCKLAHLFTEKWNMDNGYYGKFSRYIYQIWWTSSNEAISQIDLKKISKVCR